MTIAERLPVVFTDDAFTGGTTQAATRTDVVAGDYGLVEFTTGDSTGTVTGSCADSAGGTWSAQLDTQRSATHQQATWHFYRTTPFASSGSVTVTVTISATEGGKGVAFRLISGSSGPGTTSSEHAGNQQDTPGTGTDAVTSTNVTPTTQPALIVGIDLDVPGNLTPAVGTGFTDAGTGWGFGGLVAARAESKRVTSTAGVAATFTVGTSETQHALAIVFYETVAAPASAGPWASTPSPRGNSPTNKANGAQQIAPTGPLKPFTSPSFAAQRVDQERPKLPPPPRVASVEPIGTRFNTPLSNLGWLVTPPPPPRPAARMFVALAVESTAAAVQLLPWTPDTDLPRPPVPAVVRPQPSQHLGALPVSLSTVGWMSVDPAVSRRGPRLSNEPSQPTSPLTPFVSLSAAWNVTEVRPPLKARVVPPEATQPTSPLVPFVSLSAGWNTTEVRPALRSRVVPPDVVQPTSPLVPFVSLSVGWMSVESPRARPPSPLPVPNDPIGALSVQLPSVGWMAAEVARAPRVTRSVEPTQPVGTPFAIALPGLGWLATDNPTTPSRTQRAVVVDPVGNLIVLPPLPAIGWLATDNPRTPYRTKSAVVVDPVGAIIVTPPSASFGWHVTTSSPAPTNARRVTSSEPVGAPFAFSNSFSNWVSDASPSRARRRPPESVETPAALSAAPLSAAPWASLEVRPPRTRSPAPELGATLPPSPLSLPLSSLGWMVTTSVQPSSFRPPLVASVAPVGAFFPPPVLPSFPMFLPNDVSVQPLLLHRAVVVDPVGSLLVRVPLAPASPDFTAYVRPDEYVVVVRFQSVRRR